MEQLVGLAGSRRGLVLERVIDGGVEGHVWPRDREAARRLNVAAAGALERRRRHA